ncbi:MAG: AarF/ABC1/UbiB kinase family protein [Gemmatimonadaceae bacterium]|nr:AarF/ABC1/UbiB kinase family protein [Gemmatimonadaceae bacterium]
MRVIQILLRCLPLLLSFRRDRHRWLVAGRGAVRTPAFHDARAEQLVHVLASLGPTFVKLAQLFAGRSDIIPEPYVSALGTLTDRVPPVPADRIRASLIDSYGAPPETVFEHFDVEPLAAASLGQVHRARVDGREVVVKVLRPGVERLVSGDIHAARRILDLVASRLNPPHVAGLRTVLDEFERRVADEMDFRQEARYATQVRANFAKNAAIRVPEVLDAYTRQRALVLEFIDGRRVDQLGDWISTGRVRADDVLRSVMELYVQMMLVDGLFHADPHPGNVFVDTQGRLTLLDFGMVVEVPVETRRVLVQTVFASIRGDVEKVVDGFYALGLIEPGADRAMIVTMAGQLITLANERTTATERIERLTRLADEVMATLYDFPVLLPGNMVYFARTAALIEGLGVRYDTHFNAIRFATPIVVRLRREILSSLGEPLGGAPDMATALGATLGSLVAIARRASRDAVATLASQLLPALASRSR